MKKDNFTITLDKRSAISTRTATVKGESNVIRKNT